MITVFFLKPVGWGLRYGVGTYLEQLIRSLSIHEVNIYMVNYFSNLYPEISIIKKSGGLTEIYIPPPISKIRNEKGNQKYADRIADILTPFIKENPRHIFHTNYIDSLPIIKTIKLRFSSKIVSVIHLSQWQYEFNGNERELIEAINSNDSNRDSKVISIRKEQELLRLSDRIITVTKSMRSSLVNHYMLPENKMNVIYNGLDTKDIRIISNEDKLEIKRRYGFREDEKLVLFSGRLDRNKGLFFLLNSFINVLERYDNVRLVLAGDDLGSDKIPQFLAKCNNVWGKITFTGFIGKNVMRELYQVTDVGIIPSLFEQCSYTALEMIAYNIPVIMSDTDGLNELLTGRQSMRLPQYVDNKGDIVLDEKDISDAIVTLLKNDNSIINKITKDYQRIIRNKFSIEMMGNEYYKVYTSMIER